MCRYVGSWVSRFIYCYAEWHYAECRGAINETENKTQYQNVKNRNFLRSRCVYFHIYDREISKK